MNYNIEINKYLKKNYFIYFLSLIFFISIYFILIYFFPVKYEAKLEFIKQSPLFEPKKENMLIFKNFENEKKSFFNIFYDNLNKVETNENVIFYTSRAEGKLIIHVMSNSQESAVQNLKELVSKVYQNAKDVYLKDLVQIYDQYIKQLSIYKEYYDANNKKNKVTNMLNDTLCNIFETIDINKSVYRESLDSNISETKKINSYVSYLHCKYSNELIYFYNKNEYPFYIENKPIHITDLDFLKDYQLPENIELQSVISYVKFQDFYNFEEIEVDNLSYKLNITMFFLSIIASFITSFFIISFIKYRNT